MEGVRCAPAVRRRIGQRIDDLHLLDDRAGPAVRDDHRQRILVLRTDVDEMDVEPVDLGDELRQGVQPRLAPCASRNRSPNSARVSASSRAARLASRPRPFPARASGSRQCAGAGRRASLSGNSTRNGRMARRGAAASCDGSRLAAPAAARPIVAVPKSLRRSWSIISGVSFVLKRAREIADTLADPAANALAQTLMGISLHFMGDLGGARLELEAALRARKGLACQPKGLLWVRPP